MVYSAIEIRLFGGLSIKKEGQSVTELVTLKAEVLLAYLAQEPRPHSREVLATLLWDDRSQKQALSNLRTLLTSLRKHLAPYLTMTRKTVAINEKAVWLDTAIFEQQLAAASANWPIPEAIQQMENALALYKGDFLAGIFVRHSRDLEAWQVQERERLNRLAREARLRLAKYYLHARDYSAGIRHANALVQLDPLYEEAYCLLMRLLVRDGQYNAALHQYKQCQEILAEELGVEPAAMTKALYERIRIAKIPPPYEVPPQSTLFVGRETELAQIDALLDEPQCRLLTLIGPGGIGKTRLALQATIARQGEFLHGIYFVPLADTSSNSLSLNIATALNISLQGHFSPRTQLLNYLRDKEMWLLLDNLEELVDQGATLVQKILEAAPDVKLMVTSREPLNLRSERRLIIDGLSYPRESLGDSHIATLAWRGSDCHLYSAVQLFVQAAKQVRSDFSLTTSSQTAVVQICQLVHGMPLGLEIAATWVRFYNCQTIAQKIASNLDFLITSQRDMPDRHRSMRAVFEQSWRLLSLDEQMALTQVSVFRGKFTLEAALGVTQATVWALTALLDKSLLRRSSTKKGGKERLENHELLRQFAAERLGEQSEALRHRHTAYYSRFVQERSSTLKGGMQQVLSEIGQEIDNVRLAWQWAVEQSQVKPIEQCLEGLYWFYESKSWFQEGESSFAKALENETLPMRWKMLARQGVFSHRLAHYDKAKALLLESLAIARTVNDLPECAFCLTNLAAVAISQGEYMTAKEHLWQALDLARSGPLCKASSDAFCQAVEADSLRELGIVSWHEGNYTAAKKYYQQAWRIYQTPQLLSTEHSGLFNLRVQQGSSWTLNRLGFVAWSEGDYSSAKVYHEQALVLFQQIGNRQGEGTVLNHLGTVFEREYDYVAAQSNYEKALSIFRQVGHQNGESIALSNLGFVSHHQGNYSAAKEYFEQMLFLARRIGYRRGESLALACLGLIFHNLGNNHLALECSQQARQITHEIGNRAVEGYALTYLAHAQAALADFDEAVTTYQEAFTLLQQLGRTNLAMESLAGLAHLSLAQGELSQAVAYVEQILTHLENHSLEGALEPVRIYLTCYRVLRDHEASHPNSSREHYISGRAEEILQTAHHLLQERAVKISDEEIRRMYLENVAAHREIINELRIVTRGKSE